MSTCYSAIESVELFEAGRMRFVEMLANRGVLPREEAQEILEGENQDAAWFGTLAFLLGFLQREDIDQILRRQSHTGLRFGEQASHMGLLNKEQNAQIEKLQQEHRVLFTEVAWALDKLAPKKIAIYLMELLG